MLLIYLTVALGILACSLSQLLLKRSATESHRHRLFAILNPKVVASYAVFFAVLLVNIWAMGRGVKLKELAMLETLGYVFVPTLSALVLKEQVSRRTMLAVALIIAGVTVFYL